MSLIAFFFFIPYFLIIISLQAFLINTLYEILIVFKVNYFLFKEDAPHFFVLILCILFIALNQINRIIYCVAH